MALTQAMMKDVERQVKAIYATEKAAKYFATDAALRPSMDEGLTSMFNKLFAQLEKKYARIFGSASSLLAEKMVSQVGRESAVQLAASAKQISGGLTLQTKIFNSDLRETFKASINENAKLIETIPKQFIDKVSRATYRSISSGNGLEDLQNYFEKWYGEDTRKAKNVALDQTRKAYNDINADRMRAVKLNKFEWVHSGGGHTPRPYHFDKWPAGLNGGIFDVNDPPVVDEKTGERGLPGHAINCKCTMRPLLIFGES